MCSMVNILKYLMILTIHKWKLWKWKYFSIFPWFCVSVGTNGYNIFGPVLNKSTAAAMCNPLGQLSIANVCPLIVLVLPLTDSDRYCKCLTTWWKGPCRDPLYIPAGSLFKTTRLKKTFWIFQSQNTGIAHLLLPWSVSLFELLWL